MPSLFGRTTLLVGLVILPCGPARAQPEDPGELVSASVRVVDGTSGMPIAGAEISADGVVLGTSDEQGRFVISGVSPTVELLILAEGYNPAVGIIEDLQHGDVVLFPLGMVNEVIEVTDQAPTTAPGAARLDREELERIPGTGNDLLASLTVLPGVTTTAMPSFNGVIIRGSAPEDSKILVDGFEIPLLYHSIASRSILPTESIGSIEYLPGGFDVGFGRASSGVISVTTRRGERDGGGQSEVSVLDGGVLAHGPVGRDGSFMVAVRRSTIDLLLPLVIPDDAGVSLVTFPRYYDAQARVDTSLGERWQLAVSAFGSDDGLELIAGDDDDPDRRFSQRSRFVRLIADARWHRDAWSIALAASGLAQDFAFEIGRDQHVTISKLGGTARAEATRTSDDPQGLRNLVWRMGAEVDVTRHDLDLAFGRRPDEGEPGGMGMGMGGDDMSTTFDGVVVVPDLAAWSSLSADFGSRARLTAGVRTEAFLRSDDLSIQPRADLAMKVSPATTLRLAAGAYRRPAENQDELLDDELHPERATQLVVGLERHASKGVDLKTSLYYTDRSALLTRADDGGYANQGRGESFGAELLATLRQGAWFGWLSYSLSRSTRTDRPGEEERLFDYDQPQDLTAALSWRRGRWQLGGRFTYSSGTPYTPVLGAVYDSDADAYQPVYGEINAERYPAHSQVDLRIDRTWHPGPIALTAFLDVQNVTMNADVVGYTYSYDYSERYAFEGLPILPWLGLRGEL